MDKKLVMIWNDLLGENGSYETVVSLKNEYRKLSNEQLIEFANGLLELKHENMAARSRVGIFTEKYVTLDNETIVFEENEIDYHEFLIALVVFLFLTNIEDRPSIIVKIAHSLLDIDREIAEQFRLDIAERVYRKYR